MNTNNKKWIKSKEELTKFEIAIINAHPEQLVNATTQGTRGIGKSMFLYKTGTHIFQFLEGIHLDDAYLRALDHFLWTTPQIKKAVDKVLLNTDFDNISQYDLEHKYRFLAVDDAGTHLGKYQFYVDVETVDQMKARLDTIRDVTSCLLMSAPALSGLLSFLREYPDNKTIDITYNKDSHNDYGRIFTIRHPRKRWQKKGTRAYTPIKGSIFVDQWAYDEYKRRKRKALISLFQKRKGSKKDIIKMFQTLKKLKPNLKEEEIIKQLGLSDEIISILKKYHHKEYEELTES